MSKMWRGAQLRDAEDEAERRENILQRELTPLSVEMQGLRRHRADLLEERHSLQASIAALDSQHIGLMQVSVPLLKTWASSLASFLL